MEFVEPSVVTSRNDIRENRVMGIAPEVVTTFLDLLVQRHDCAGTKLRARRRHEGRRGTLPGTCVRLNWLRKP